MELLSSDRQWSIAWWKVESTSRPIAQLAPEFVSLVPYQAELEVFWPKEKKVRKQYQRRVAHTKAGARGAKPVVVAKHASHALSVADSLPPEGQNDEDDSNSDADVDEHDESDTPLQDLLLRAIDECDTLDPEEVFKDDILEQKMEHANNVSDNAGAVPMIPEASASASGGAVSESLVQGAEHVQPSQRGHGTPAFRGPNQAATAFIEVYAGRITYYANKGYFECVCGNKFHGRCVLTRNAKAKKVAGGRFAGGRPLGMMLAWLAKSFDFPTKSDHREGIVLDTPYEERAAEREWLKSSDEGMALLSCEREHDPDIDGPHEEPELLIGYLTLHSMLVPVKGLRWTPRNRSRTSYRRKCCTHTMDPNLVVDGLFYSTFSCRDWQVGADYHQWTTTVLGLHPLGTVLLKLTVSKSDPTICQIGFCLVIPVTILASEEDSCPIFYTFTQRKAMTGSQKRGPSAKSTASGAAVAKSKWRKLQTSNCVCDLCAKKAEESLGANLTTNLLFQYSGNVEVSLKGTFPKETPWALYAETSTKAGTTSKALADNKCEECYTLWSTGFSYLSWEKLVETCHGDETMKTLVAEARAVMTKQKPKPMCIPELVNASTSIELHIKRDYMVLDAAELRKATGLPRLSKVALSKVPQLKVPAAAASSKEDETLYVFAHPTQLYRTCTVNVKVVGTQVEQTLSADHHLYEGQGSKFLQHLVEEQQTESGVGDLLAEKHKLPELSDFIDCKLKKREEADE
eukprot:1308965-Amphidinium_carterae.1